MNTIYPYAANVGTRTTLATVGLTLAELERGGL